MKVEFVDDNIIVFLNKYITKNLDYKDKIVLEKELKNIFDKLNNFYNVKIKGYYDIHIYIDDNYGAILELIENEMDFLEYDDNLIDMRIIVTNVEFLYRIEDVINLDKEYNIYLYKDNMYLEILDEVDDIEEGCILENSEVVYKNIDEIKKYGKILKKIDFML